MFFIFFENFFDTVFLANFYLQSYGFFFIFYLFPILPECTLTFFLIYSLISFFQDKVQTSFIFFRWVFYFVVLFFLLLLTLFNPVVLSSFGGGVSLLFCWFSQFAKLLILFFTGLVIYFSKKKIYKNFFLNCMLEFPIIIGFSILFLFFLLSSFDFFTAYLSIEGLSLSLYVLAALLNNNFVSLEAAIKYFSLGALSTGILLFGLSFFYGIVGSVDFLEIQLFLTQSFFSIGFQSQLIFSFFCILLGLFFKLSAFPCHWWVADVYEGVWLPITAFFAIVIKLAFFLFFFRIVFTLLFSVIYIYQPFFLFSAVGSLIVGTFGALYQFRIKRFLAFTSMSQVGFILLGISTCSIGGLVSSTIFLLVYCISSSIMFGLLLNTTHVITMKSITYLCELYIFSTFNSKYATYLSVVLLSMAGVPPLGGFLGKLLIYICLLESRLEWTVLFVLFLNIISSFYYLNFIHYLWFVKYNKLRLFFFNTSFFFDFILCVALLFLIGFLLIFPNFFILSLNLTVSCLWPFSFF